MCESFINLKKLVLCIILLVLSILLTNFIYITSGEACTGTITSATMDGYTVHLTWGVTDCGWCDCSWSFKIDPPYTYRKLDGRKKTRSIIGTPSGTTYHHEGTGTLSHNFNERGAEYQSRTMTITCLGLFRNYPSGQVGTGSGSVTITLPGYDDDDIFITCYEDADHDEYGNPNISMLVGCDEEEECSCPDGWSGDDTDCDDGDPCAPDPKGDKELCDDLDHDCDGDPYNGFEDRGTSCDGDGDGFTTGTKECAADGSGLVCEGDTPPSAGEDANNGDPLDSECLQGHPVNITTGNAYDVKQDLYIPGRGLGLSFERSYNSREDYNGPLGYGLTLNYNIYLEKLSDTEIKIKGGDGAGHYFIKTVNDDYASVTGDDTTITENPDSTYTYISRNGTRYQFNNVGKLLSITDRNSNALSFGYDGNQNLISVTDGAGRQITFDYDAGNRICALYGPATSLNASGLVASYAYDEAGNLSQVVYVDGATLNYSYDDPYDIHNLTSTTNGAGEILAAQEYDSQDRAVSPYSEGDLWRLNISYDSATQTTVTDIRGNVKVYTGCVFI